MAELNDPVPLPPGWDCKYDARTSKYYFVNYYTKSTTWEDPRVRHGSLQNHGTPIHQRVTSAIGEYFPLQHGSPDLRRNHVYPSNSHASPLRAFQMPANYSPKQFPLQEMNKSGMSPLSNRNQNGRVQETTLTQDTEELVSKIGGMFPTVSETHIRVLLKKYYNREAVVMSALQVEKHPITTPGPFSTPPPIKATNTRGIIASPIPQRPGSGGSGSFIGSPRIGEQFKNSPRPHSSPKMKLRYMKSIFPTADATLILDILSNNDNNVQKASEILLSMGFEKKDIKPPRLQQKKTEPEKSVEEEPSIPKKQTPTIKTTEEKQSIKVKLQEDHPNIPEQIINLALDSVNYDSDRANQILQIMEQEDSKTNAKTSGAETAEEVITVERIDSNVVQNIQEIAKTPDKDIVDSPVAFVPIKNETNNKLWRNRIKIGNKNVKIGKDLVNGQEPQKDYTSNCILQPVGPNLEFQRGPNPELLLPDYTTWNGANPNLVTGRNMSLAKGPNKLLLQSKTYQAKGPNNDLRKGPIFGLAKGSIYSQIKSMLCETRAN